MIARLPYHCTVPLKRPKLVGDMNTMVKKVVKICTLMHIRETNMYYVRIYISVYYVGKGIVLDIDTLNIDKSLHWAN